MQALCPGQRGVGELSGRSWHEAHASEGCRPAECEKRGLSPPCGSEADAVTAKTDDGDAGVSFTEASASSSSDAKRHAADTRRRRPRDCARGAAGRFLL